MLEELTKLLNEGKIKFPTVENSLLEEMNKISTYEKKISDKLRDKILAATEALAIKTGLDIDGDLITYGGKTYYVDCLHKSVKEVE